MKILKTINEDLCQQAIKAKLVETPVYNIQWRFNFNKCESTLSTIVKTWLACLLMLHCVQVCRGARGLV